MDRITALRDMLASTISTMEYNMAQHERIGGQWPYADTYEEAKGRLRAFKEIHKLITP
jgi:hypothetical protein